MKRIKGFTNWYLRRRNILLFGFIILGGTMTHAQGIATRTMTLNEMADRVAIKELIDAYSHDADRRKPEAQAGLFTPDGILENYEGEPSPTNKPAAILRGRKELMNGFASLKKYDITMHFNGQSDIVVNGDSATGETYCLAHQFWKENNERVLMIIAIRYYDTFVRMDGRWFFAMRKLIFDWTDRRLSKPRNPGE